MDVARVVSLILPVLVPGLFLIVSLKRGWFSAWRRPLDRGATAAGAPLIGANKTWFGVANYVIGGAAVALVLGLAGELVSTDGPFHPVLSMPWSPVVGASVGGAYAAGEVLNSMVKRRLGVTPGRVTGSRWRPVQLAADLADGIVCACLVYVAWGVSLPMAAGVLVAGVAIHLSTDALMRALQLKRHQREGAEGRDREVV